MTDITFGSVPAGDVEISPPASAKVTDLGKLAKGGGTAERSASKSGPTGLEALRAAPFRRSRPRSSWACRARTVRLVGHGDSSAVLAVYGHGLGAIVVLERTGSKPAARAARSARCRRSRSTASLARARDRSSARS